MNSRYKEARSPHRSRLADRSKPLAHLSRRGALRAGGRDGFGIDTDSIYAECIAAFHCLYGDSAQIAMLADSGGALLALNGQGAAALAGPATGRPLAGLYAPWAGAIVRDEGLPAARVHGQWRGELEFMRPGGRLEPVALTIDYRAGTGGGDACFLCRQCELEDHDSYGSRLRFKRLFEAHPHPMWVYDIATLRFLVVNAAAVEHYGYTEAEFMGMTIRDIRPRDELSRLDSNLASMPGKGAEYAGVWTHRCKDGRLIAVDISSHSLTLGGRAARFVFAHDISARLRMQNALHASQEMQHHVINHIPHQIFWKDRAGVYQGGNNVFARAAGLADAADIAGCRDEDFPWSHNAVRIRDEDARIMASDRPQLNAEDQMVFSDGSVHWFLINKLPLHDEGGAIIGVLGTIEDVSARKRAELTLELRGRALDASVNAIVITAGDAIEYANPAFVQLSGYGLGEVLGRSLESLLAGADKANDEALVPAEREQLLADQLALRAVMAAHTEVTMLLRSRHKEGRPFWSQLHVAPVRGRDGAISHHVCVLTDMTATMDYQAQLEHQANHDALTELPNRSLLGDRLEQAISYAQRYGQIIWVVFIDLDNFKLVNDSLGHHAGDLLLRTVSSRLRACVRDSDTVARLGGDEFMLILPDALPDASPDKLPDAGTDGTSGARPAPSMLHKVLANVSAPVMLGTTEVAITCSVGVSLYPNDGADAQTLLRHADIAMYRAKEAGRNQVQFYESAMQARVAERAAIEAELRHALARRELSLHYQPKAELRGGRVVGMEALLRWHHPVLGDVAPARFIGVAEETGLIVAIGRWVIRTACAQNRAWQDAGLPALRVAVNLSARQFRDKGLADDIVAALTDSGLQPRYLELELTESLMMHNVGEAVATVGRLKQLGVALSVDDFGTGYSSLSYLKLFPLDCVKIDQSFIHDMLWNPSVAAIVRAVISLGHSLNFKVIAEGVETAAQLAYLRRYECDEMQGYYFSRPIDAAAFTALLESDAVLPDEEPDDAGSRTLLLLDDEPHVLAALSRQLRRDGYTILQASTVQQAFELLALHEVQVIVSDQRMPEMHGTEFLSRVKKLYPETVRIILSGHAELEAVLNAVNRGEVYRFYTKPWDEQLLRDEVRDAFRYHRLLQDARAVTKKWLPSM